MKPRLYVDLDNVICDTDSVVRELIANHIGVSAARDDVTCFEYWKALGYDKSREASVWTQFHQRSCAKVKPLPHALSALKRLTLFCEIHVVTTRNPEAEQLTRNWLTSMQVPFDSLSFLNGDDEKAGIVCNHNSMLIDDKAESVSAVAKRGGQAIILDNPWNKTVNNERVRRNYNWPGIYRVLLQTDPYSSSFRDLHLWLYNIAKSALTYSYSPYSGFSVGAAVLTTTGKTFKGCNVENSSFASTACAERVAMYSAICEGNRAGDFVAMSIATSNRKFISTPCGLCRQVLSEFSDQDLPLSISCLNQSDNFDIKDICDYLPDPFGVVNE